MRKLKLHIQNLKSSTLIKPIANAMVNYPKTTLTALTVLFIAIYLFTKSVFHVYELNINSLNHFLLLDLSILDSIGVLDLVITTYNEDDSDQTYMQRYLSVGLKKFLHYNLYSYIVFSILSLCFCMGVGIVICIKIIASEILLEKVIDFIVKDYNNGLPKCIEISEFITNLFT